MCPSRCPLSLPSPFSLVIQPNELPALFLRYDSVLVALVVRFQMLLVGYIAKVTTEVKQVTEVKASTKVAEVAQEETLVCVIECFV